MSDNQRSLNADHFLNAAKLGVDAVAFYGTPIGKHLQAKAQSELDKAMNELVEADPDDVKANRDIRNRIHVVAMFLKWMDEAIAAGSEAYFALKDDDDRARFPN